MADLDDAMQVIVNTVGAILYPNGSASLPGGLSADTTGVTADSTIVTADSSSANSVSGYPAQIFPGWPIPAQLDAAVKTGLVIVNVYPRPEERNTTRYLLKHQLISMNVATLALSVNGVVISISGTVPPVTNPHNLSIGVNGQPYVYQTVPTDTLNSIASNLAQLIALGVPGTVSFSNMVMLPAGSRINQAIIGLTGVSGVEQGRQERRFQIGIWANSPMARKAVAAAIDLPLRSMPFLTMPDSFAARFRYVGSPINDRDQKTGLYRRDLMYQLEYATTTLETDTQVTQISVTFSGSP